jgi:hypothetical protein
VVVHCQRGNGRTGMVLALMLALLGVADADIAFESSEPCRAFDCHNRSKPPQLARSSSVRSADPAALLNTLCYLRDRYGGAERYLRRGGPPASPRLMRWNTAWLRRHSRRVACYEPTSLYRFRACSGG